MVNKFTTKNFEEEVEKSKGIVVVDLYADWCGPCQMMSPIIDEIAKENPQVKVGKVNCDEESDIALKYEIMSIPTILIFKDGKLTKRFVGLTSKEKIIEEF